MTDSPTLPDGARRVLFTGAKGGVGTSTVTVLHALALARAGFPTTMTAATDNGDLAALVGAAPTDGELLDVNALTALAASGSRTPHVVIDGGTTPPEGLSVDEHYLVTRACYLALRRALAHPLRAHGVVLLRERDRALSERDIEDVLGLPVVATLPVEPAMARAIDAGLLAQCHPRATALCWTHAAPVGPAALGPSRDHTATG
jgi:hypothetical protein